MRTRLWTKNTALITTSTFFWLTACFVKINKTVRGERKSGLASLHCHRSFYAVQSYSVNTCTYYYHRSLQEYNGECFCVTILNSGHSPVMTKQTRSSLTNENSSRRLDRREECGCEPWPGTDDGTNLLFCFGLNSCYEDGSKNYFLNLIFWPLCYIFKITIHTKVTFPRNRHVQWDV